MTIQTPTLDSLIAGHDVSDSRMETLSIAMELGADEVTLATLRDALRLSRGTTIVLPAHRYESLSRGRGWARMGRGDNAIWGERTDSGDYRVGPGRWSVGGSDGYRRKDSTEWTVRHVAVGTQAWTIAD
jgi:hypothetical protein